MDYVNEKLYPRKRMKGRRGCRGAGSKCTQKFHAVNSEFDIHQVEVKKHKNKYYKEDYKSKNKHKRMNHDDGGMAYGVTYSVNKKKRWELVNNLKKGHGYFAVDPMEGGLKKIERFNLDEIHGDIDRKTEAENDSDSEGEIDRTIKGKKKNKLTRRRFSAPGRGRVIGLPGERLMARKKKRMRGAKKVAKRKASEKNKKALEEKEKEVLSERKDFVIDSVLSNEDYYEFEEMSNRKMRFSRTKGNRGYSPWWRLGIVKNHHTKRRVGIKNDIKAVFDHK